MKNLRRSQRVRRPDSRFGRCTNYYRRWDSRGDGNFCSRLAAGIVQPIFLLSDEISRWDEHVEGGHRHDTCARVKAWASALEVCMISSQDGVGETIMSAGGAIWQISRPFAFPSVVAGYVELLGKHHTQRYVVRSRSLYMLAMHLSPY